MPRALFFLLLAVSLGAIASGGLVSSWLFTCDDARAACLLESSAQLPVPGRSPAW